MLYSRINTKQERVVVMPIRVRLNEILSDKGVSQRELGRMTGLRPNTINHLCSGEVDRIYLETLEKVCLALDVKIEEVLILNNSD